MDNVLRRVGATSTWMDSGDNVALVVWIVAAAVVPVVLVVAAWYVFLGVPSPTVEFELVESRADCSSISDKEGSRVKYCVRPDATPDATPDDTPDTRREFPGCKC